MSKNNRILNYVVCFCTDEMTSLKQSPSYQSASAPSCPSLSGAPASTPSAPVPSSPPRYGFVDVVGTQQQAWVNVIIFFHYDWHSFKLYLKLQPVEHI